MDLKTVTKEDFDKYRDALVQLYIDAFSKGKSFQFHEVSETLDYLQSIFEVGYGILATYEKSLIGATLITPLSFDTLLPQKICSAYDPSKSLYVAEMMVDENFRGKGIGRKMLAYFFEKADRNVFEHAFIRVWIKNENALALYKKMGFKTVASLVQSKLLADKSGMFDFEKIYLHQALNS